MLGMYYVQRHRCHALVFPATIVVARDVLWLESFNDTTLYDTLQYHSEPHPPPANRMIRLANIGPNVCSQALRQLRGSTQAHMKAFNVPIQNI